MSLIDSIRLALGATQLSKPGHVPVPTAEFTAEFDVFLSHNSQDKPIVRRLALALKSRGWRVWLDEEQLVPGRPWQEELENIIQTTKSAAVLIGENGFGSWETPEMRVCLDECVRRKLPVIPVLLPDAPKKLELPPFLGRFTWVDLSDGLTDDGIQRLEWGITGRKPEDESINTISTTLEPDEIHGAFWICVLHNGDNYLRIECSRSSKRRDLDLPKIPLPPKKFNEIMDKQHSLVHIQNVFQSITEYASTSLGDVVDWINDLLKQNINTDIKFIIIDKTDTEIPWELLEIGNGYLGAQTVVSRWVEMEYRGESIPIEQPQSKLQVQGGAIYFLDPESEGRANSERETLKSCDGKEIATFENLLDILTEPNTPGVALTYLNFKISHDIQRSIDELPPETMEYKLKPMMNLRVLGTERKKLPVMIFNACHSGRVICTRNERYGWPATFIAAAACAYIGTLAEVVDEEAVRIGTEILNAAHTRKEGVNLAGFLRELREEASHGFKPYKNDEKQWLHFMSAFFYVYYGDPRLCLKLGKVNDNA